MILTVRTKTMAVANKKTIGKTDFILKWVQIVTSSTA